MMAADGSRVLRGSHGVAAIVLLVATVWFAFATAWGLFGVVTAGHLGAGSAGNAMAAEQMLRWKIWYPAWNWNEPVAPTNSSYICHHPFGQYYIDALFLWLFGHRDFVVRLPAVLMSMSLPPLLYGIAREKWGPVSGAVAAAAYSVIPIALGFSSFMNLETVCIFGALLFFWGHSRHMTTGRKRYLTASFAGLVVTCSGDWVGYVIVAPALAWSFLRVFVLPSRATPRFRREPYAHWWAVSVAIVAVTALLWIGLFYRADAIAGWLAEGSARSGVEGTKLHDVLEARKNWIDFCFTPLAIRIGRLAAPVCLLRLCLFRCDEEVYALSLLFGAIFQYVAFKQGADVHIFWPHYFAPYYALSLAQAAQLVSCGVSRLVGVFAPGQRAAVAGWVGLLVGLSPSLAMASDAAKSVRVWRETGGRYDDNGSALRSNADFAEVIRQVMLPKCPLRSRVAVHASAGWGWELQWEMQGNADVATGPLASNATEPHMYWVARGSGLRSAEASTFSTAAHVRVYGDMWVVDQRERPAPLEVMSTETREPNVLEWLLWNPTERVRRMSDRLDPWLTWEYRTHLGQAAAEPPGEPKSLDEMRIAHNVAVVREDADGAERWRERIDAQITRQSVRFGDTLRLVGTRLVEGVEPRVECWFEVLAPPAGDAALYVRSTVVAASKLSLIPPDTVDRQMLSVSFPPTKLWRRGFLYKVETVLNHRIGRERYLAAWVSIDGTAAPRRFDGRPDTLILELD